MAGFSTGHNLAFAFGLLANVISFFVFLLPLPTSYQIFKKKSTEGFKYVPYVVAIFRAMLLMYYAFLKTNAIITINSFGCFIEIIYIGVYIFYAPKKIKTVKLLVLMLGGFGLIVIATFFLVKAPMRVCLVGWICLVFSEQVIPTEIVEFMPFSLSFSPALKALMWFFYGLLINDYNIAIPNILGFFFGVVRMVLYMYRNKTKKVMEENIQPADQLNDHVVAVPEEDKKLPELTEQVIEVAMLQAMVCQEMVPVVPFPNGHGMVENFAPPARPNTEISVCV